ncbi:polysaccharide deacetylase family protein [Nonomuraea sediminis]|uniref:polysaccharide deacetylase family protein n=1 Tax=Nonomuraea sediminis TaxID=2835864 RepID=UPI001BDD8CDB|nr:polysaccharide deacetylase family protein [Nonomuraea sediminis]
MRQLIINADDYGMCRAANTGITSLLEAGAISSATVMTPCPWAPDAIATASRGGYDVGVHLTLTSEWEGYRWSPLTTGTTLRDAAGYFHADSKSVEEQADPEDVRVELIAQLDRAIALGLDPSHADNHMGSLYGLATGRDFLTEALGVCAAYGLPFRLPRTLDGMGLPPELEPFAEAAAARADAAGVVILDRLWTLSFHQKEGETYESFKAEMIELIRALRPGVTEIYIHPFEDTDELRHIMPHHAKRAMELRVFTDPEVRRALAEEEITLIGWRDLRDRQRAR